jgi:hypothetical protein
MHWLSHLWFGYFWPSLQGNGPEALVQTVAYGAIGLTLIPVVRRWLKKEAARAEAEAKGIELEVEKIEKDLLKPFRWVGSKVRLLPSLRLSVKKDTPVVEAAVKEAVPVVEAVERPQGAAG